jgi:signal transduction histidine kinase
VADTPSNRAPELRDASILIVDDEEPNTRLLTRILTRAGFQRVHATTDSTDVIRLFGQVAPDLVILDVRMPVVDGFQVLEQLRTVVSAADFLPVLAVTGDSSAATRHRVLVAGAKDFLEKPFETAEVVVRVENLLMTRRLHRSLQQQNIILEEKVRERTVQLETALAAAEAGSRAKSQFLATISHELRTPLNAVIGFANHLQKNKAGNLLPQDLAFLQRIGGSGTHLLSLINDILDLSRVEAGKMSVERAPVALDDVIRETMEQFAAANGESPKRVVGRVSLPSGLRPIMTDGPKLRRVLTNLVGNATKFTEDGYFRVAVSADPQGNALRIDVIDTGIGIPTDRLGAIFDMFEQADNSTQRRFGGTGLGLAISKTLCELLGYRLTVVSAVGSGSGFSVLLDSAAAVPQSYAELASSYDDSPAVCA